MVVASISLKSEKIRKASQGVGVVGSTDDSEDRITSREGSDHTRTRPLTTWERPIPARVGGHSMLEELQNGLYQRAKENKDAKFNMPHDKIYRMDVLEEAWKIVSENNGAAGIDRQSILDIEAEGVEQFLTEIQTELRTGTYKAECVKSVFIPKPNGKMRPLGIPTVRDRIVQQAVKLIIEPVFEADFKDFSYAYRKGRSAKGASLEIYKWLNFGLTNVIDVDIEGFFDHLDHELLTSFIRKRATDRYVISLITQWLMARVVHMNTKVNPIEGTPQGRNISSPCKHLPQ